jgi:cytochrome c biogenesis protein CcdA
MARQIGAVLGVAILVSVLGIPHGAAAALTAYRHGWYSIVAVTVLAAFASLLIRRGPGPAAPASGNGQAGQPQQAAAAR